MVLGVRPDGRAVFQNLIMVSVRVEYAVRAIDDEADGKIYAGNGLLHFHVRLGISGWGVGPVCRVEKGVEEKTKQAFDR